MQRDGRTAWARWPPPAIPADGTAAPPRSLRRAPTKAHAPRRHDGGGVLERGGGDIPDGKAVA